MAKNQPENALTDNNDDLLDINSVVSTTECTGLIPSAPCTESEARAYTDLYKVPKPKPEKDSNPNH